MIGKKMMMSVVAVAMMLTSLTSCTSWLDDVNDDNEVPVLTRDASFVAESVIAKHYSGVYLNYKDYENFFFEFVGAESDDGKRDVVVLDLLAPEGTTVPTGTFTVSYSGDYIALPVYDIVDAGTNMRYRGGSYYGVAENGYIGDEYGFFTSGEVRISIDEEANYTVEVDVKSNLPTIQMTYTGPIKFIEGSN